MVGLFVWDSTVRWWGTVTQGRYGGMGVAVARLAPGGRWLSWRMTRLGRRLARAGVHRLLAPVGFSHWDAMRQAGLRPVDATPFLQENCGELMMYLLEKGGYKPEKCWVALRGQRVNRGMVQSAERLVHGVRGLSITAPSGGEGLAQSLRRKWGLALRPDGDGPDGVICFDPRAAHGDGIILAPFGPSPQLAGVTFRMPRGWEGVDTEPLEVLALLWERGEIPREKIEFYLT